MPQKMIPPQFTLPRLLRLLRLLRLPPVAPPATLNVILVALRMLLVGLATYAPQR